MKTDDFGGGSGDEFQLRLANGVDEFQQAYVEASSEYRDRLEMYAALSEAPPEDAIVINGPGHVYNAVPLGWDQPVLMSAVEPFRVMGDPETVGTLVHSLTAAREALPDDGLQILFNLVREFRGPAARAYQWHFGALGWSLGHQRDVLRALILVAAAYRELYSKTRTNVLGVIDAGVTALRQAAGGAEGNVGFDLKRIALDAALDTAWGLATGGGKGAAEGLAGTVVQSLVGTAWDSVDDGEARALSGTAEEILVSTNDSLERIRDGAARRSEALTESLSRIEEAINDPEPFERADPAWKDLALPLPGRR
jgi:hypothetical protein